MRVSLLTGVFGFFDRLPFVTLLEGGGRVGQPGLLSARTPVRSASEPSRAGRSGTWRGSCSARDGSIWGGKNEVDIIQSQQIVVTELHVPHDDSQTRCAALVDSWSGLKIYFYSIGGSMGPSPQTPRGGRGRGHWEERADHQKETSLHRPASSSASANPTPGRH